MKAKTQIEAITMALIAGEKLTALSSLRDFGSLRLGGQMFAIQKKYGIDLIKNPVKGKTRYNTTFVVTEYSMRRSDAKRIQKELKKVANQNLIFIKDYKVWSGTYLITIQQTMRRFKGTLLDMKPFYNVAQTY